MNIKRAVRTPTLLPTAVAATQVAPSKLIYCGPASQPVLLRDTATSLLPLILPTIPTSAAVPVDGLHFLSYVFYLGVSD